MLIKGITLFLIAMLVLGMFGKLRFPSVGPRRDGKCAKCGRHRIGKGPCACGKA
ncbi:MAG: hypothetical protein ACO3U1_09080 [Marivivens sp.]|jgi:hypothetical protein